MNHTPNTPPRAVILCTDSRLSRLLETELAYLGVAARATESVPEPDGELCLLVADGDAFPVADCLELAEASGCPLLLFGREDQDLPPDRGVFLRRPFGLDRLESVARGLISPSASHLWAMASGSPPPKKTYPEAPAPESGASLVFSDDELAKLRRDAYVLHGVSADTYLTGWGSEVADGLYCIDPALLKNLPLGLTLNAEDEARLYADEAPFVYVVATEVAQ